MTEKLKDSSVVISEWKAMADGAINTKIREIKYKHPSQYSFPGLPKQIEVCTTSIVTTNATLQ